MNEIERIKLIGIACPGCDANMAKCHKIKPQIFYGRLSVQCPMCKFISPIEILPGGWIKIIEDEVETYGNQWDEKHDFRKRHSKTGR
jgi:hypothetical protein